MALLERDYCSRWAHHIIHAYTCMACIPVGIFRASLTVCLCHKMNSISPKAVWVRGRNNLLLTPGFSSNFPGIIIRFGCQSTTVKFNKCLWLLLHFVVCGRKLTWSCTQQGINHVAVWGIRSQVLIPRGATGRLGWSIQLCRHHNSWNITARTYRALTENINIQWSLYFKTTHGTKKMWSYIAGGLKIKVI